MKISIINGPNLNLLGKREPSIYGDQSFMTYFDSLKVQFPEIIFDYFQSNIEGELINKLHEIGFSADVILLNAGAYTHTSVAILDALRSINIPKIEIHLSNIYKREDYRQKSITAEGVDGLICGFGSISYILAIEAINRLINKK